MVESYKNEWAELIRIIIEHTNKVLAIKSYFCNPYHSWEKGTVENIIGIIRRFYPKKTDWKNISQWDLNRGALNILDVLTK